MTNIDDKSQGVYKELNLYFSARRITMNAKSLGLLEAEATIKMGVYQPIYFGSFDFELVIE